MSGFSLKKNRSLFALVVLLLFVSLMAGPFQGRAQAEDPPGPVNVGLRVEGASETILHVSLEVASPDGDPQTGLDALTQGLDAAGISYNIEDFGFGPYVQAINGEEAGTFGGWDGWMFVVNNQMADEGAGTYQLQEGDRILFYYGMFPPDTLIPTVSISPKNPTAGSGFTVAISSTYYDWDTGSDVTVQVDGVLITFNGQENTTDENGEAAFTAPQEAGTYFLKARKDDEGSYPLIVRTASIPVAVGEDLTVNKEPLQAAIMEAEDLLAGVTAGESPGQYPQEAIDSLTAALDNSKSVEADQEASQEEVDASLEALKEAVKDFKAAVIKQESPGLNKALADAVAFYEGKAKLTSWWEMVALRGAGVDLSKGDWPGKLPDWNSQSLPADSPATTYAGFILGLMARGEHPGYAWGSRDLPRELAAKQQENGSFGDGINSTIWGIIALHSAQFPFAEDSAAAYLLSQQLEDGGFTLFGDTGDPDMTGMTLVALSPYKSLPGVKTAIDRALDFLERVQKESGGFASWGSENANTNAAVLTGLIAVGEDIFSTRWVKKPSLYDALVSFQLENGSFSFLMEPWESNDMATSQALLALGDLDKGEPAFFRLSHLRELPRTDSAATLGLLLGFFGLGAGFLAKRRK